MSKMCKILESIVQGHIMKVNVTIPGTSYVLIISFTILMGGIWTMPGGAQGFYPELCLECTRCGTWGAMYSARD